MPSTGELLRAERERRRLSIQQAADATNIRSDHLRAIEAGDWGVFAAPVYVRGFVRTYGRYLRLDDTMLVTQLDAELAGRGDFAEPGNPNLPRQGPLDFVMLRLALLRWQVLFPLALGLAVLLAAWWGWRRWQDRPAAEPAASVEPRLYQPRSAPTPGVLPLPAATNAPGAARSR